MSPSSMHAAFSRLVPRVCVPFIAAFALLFGMVSPAHAAATVSGKVVAANGGSPVQGVNVYLYERVVEDGDAYWSFVTGDYTGDLGTYSFDSIAPGTYRVSGEVTNGNANFVRGDSDAFTVPSSGSKAVPDLRLQPGGSVTGTVTRAGASPNFTNVTVYRLEDEDEGGGWFGVRWATSDQNGVYSVGGLETGVYRIGFRDQGNPATHLEQFWNNASTIESATSFSVTQGQVTSGKSATLVRGGKISGTVRAKTSTGPGLDGITVSAYEKQVVDGVTRWVEAGYGYTDSTGAYTVSPLRAGTYHLQFDDYGFSDSGDAQYDSEFYENASTQDSAKAVDVGDAESVTGKNAVLALRGSVSGTIKKAGGAPLTNGTATLYRAERDGDEVYWSRERSASTNAKGEYDIKNVASGSYHLEFGDDDGVYLGEYFDDAKTHETAKSVDVAPATATAERNATLSLGGSISGVVTGPGGSHPAVCVVAYEEVVDSGTSRYQRTDGPKVTTALDGSYSIKGLETGNHKLRFDDCDDIGLAREFFDDAKTLATATPIDVTAGSTSAGKDVTMQQSATISGVVTGGDGYTADDRVNVIDPATGAVIRSADVEDGTYSVTGLYPSTYKVEFARLSGMASVAAEFFKDTAEELGRAFGTTVTLAPGQKRMDVNASLVPGGHIRGTLVDGAGRPLADYQVHAYTDDRSLVTRADYTNDDGSFDIGGLTTGSYKVVANLGRQGTAGRGYYAGTPALSSVPTNASPVAVTIGGTVSLPGTVVLGALPPVVVTPPVVGPPAPPVTPAIVKVRPSISVKAKGGKKRVTLTVTVRAAGVQPTGRVVVKLGSRTLKTVTLRNGKATIVLKKQKKGKKAYKIVYGGDTRVTNRSVTSKKVTIR